MMHTHKNIVTCLAFIGLLMIAGCTVYAADILLPVPDEIRNEAVRANDSPVGHPLPLISHWNAGIGINSDQYNDVGFPPFIQMDYIAQGRHYLPTFGWPQTDKFFETTWKPEQADARDKWLKGHLDYFEAPIKKAAELKLPLAFMGTQWESVLTYDKAYFDLPAEKNPNLVDADGKIQQAVDPFGPIELWREVGRQWSNSKVMKQLQAWYPDPPLVSFYSNNEHAKLQWQNAEQSQRYLTLYGKGHDDEFKRKVVMDAYIERYRALEEGIREGLTSPAWKKNAIFVGYDAFGPYWCRAWDAGTPSYYVNNWQSNTDYTVDSPQIQTMRWIPGIAEMHKINPKFRFEMSTWDGNVGDLPNDKRRFYAGRGQEFTPARYGGYVQFGLWSLRPRVVMDFRGWMEKRANIEPFMTPIMDSIDRVYTNPILRRFWRTGELVPNRAHPHPGDEIANNTKPAAADTWFLLDTSRDPQRPWKWSTELPVYALALVQGKVPQREWLVYAHAPLGARTAVKVTVPEYGEITIDAPQSGSFYLVTEKTKQISPVVIGGPASVFLEVKSPFAKIDEPIPFNITDPYKPNGTLTTFAWDFGDGGTATGPQVTHTFTKSGQYLVTLKATDGKDTVVNRAAVIFAGFSPEQDLVLRYLMGKQAGLLIPDASGKGNAGFLRSGTWVDDPQRGTVLQLDGKQDFIAVNNTADINMGPAVTSRTILLWFKAGDLAKRQMIYEEGGYGNGFNIYLFKDKLYAGAWAGAKTSWISCEDVDPNQWYHVALVLRNATAEMKQDILELYVNGQKVATGEGTQIPAHQGDVAIGRNGGTLYADQRSDNPGDYFAGQIGGIEIYNRALTAEEIAKKAK